jgi:hypothetical protein
MSPVFEINTKYSAVLCGNKINFISPTAVFEIESGRSLVTVEPQGFRSHILKFPEAKSSTDSLGINPASNGFQSQTEAISVINFYCCAFIGE